MYAYISVERSLIMENNTSHARHICVGKYSICEYDMTTNFGLDARRKLFDGFEGLSYVTSIKPHKSFPQWFMMMRPSGFWYSIVHIICE